jgi:hypothetical protein
MERALGALRLLAQEHALAVAGEGSAVRGQVAPAYDGAP